MKGTAIFLISLLVGTALDAQTLDTVHVIYKPGKFRPREHIRLMSELLDTMDAFGRHITISRSYYFDKEKRTISSVREYDNPKTPRSGTQVVYTFAGNHLTRVIVTPPRSVCRNCISDYVYSNDTLLSKVESVYTIADPRIFIRQAHTFQKKVPSHLPWGYFEDEILVNGRPKRLKRLKE